MIITDYLTEEQPLQWQWASQLGLRHAVIRMPERSGFDLLDFSHWQAYYDRFMDAGFRPVVVEPLPNGIYESIKSGLPDAEQRMTEVKTMLSHMGRLGIGTLCLNFMAHIGWCRTDTQVPLRGGALGTGFSLAAYRPTDDFSISAGDVWRNLEHFLREIVPTAERYGVRLALHPDDPPVPSLGGVARVLTSLQQIDRAVHLVDSDMLGVTLCQGCYSAMGENVDTAIRHFAGQNKLFFVHFRDISGRRDEFHETFHDDGQTDMAASIRTYREVGFDGPVRVDHVPTLAGEANDNAGYTSLGRLYAIGYLRGLLEASQ